MRIASAIHKMQDMFIWSLLHTKYNPVGRHFYIGYIVPSMKMDNQFYIWNLLDVTTRIR